MWVLQMKLFHVIPRAEVLPASLSTRQAPVHVPHYLLFKKWEIKGGVRLKLEVWRTIFVLENWEGFSATCFGQSQVGHKCLWAWSLISLVGHCWSTYWWDRDGEQGVPYSWTLSRSRDLWLPSCSFPWEAKLTLNNCIVCVFYVVEQILYIYILYLFFSLKII